MPVPDVADLARANQIVERAQRLVDRNLRLRAVQLIEVDPVGVEPLERRLAGFDQVPATQAARVRVLGVLGEESLRCEHDARTFTPQRFPDEPLARTGGVGVGRVDEVDAVLDRVLDDRNGVLLVRMPAEHHRAQAQLADFDAGAAEIAVVHARAPYGRWPRLMIMRTSPTRLADTRLAPNPVLASTIPRSAIAAAPLLARTWHMSCTA
jgi:hypothetical protein